MTVAAVPSNPFLLDTGGLHVGRRLHAEGHQPTLEPRRALHHSRIVGVRDEHITWPGVLRYLRLGIRNGIGGAEETHVRVADVGPDADLRFRDADQRANLTRMVHSQFDHRDVRTGAQLK